MNDTTGGHVSRRSFLARAGVAVGAAELAALGAVDSAAAAVPPTEYRVSDYGAVGNGTTDDTAKIQAALDAAKAGGGGTVVFHAGTFRVSRPLTLYSKVVLRGAGVRATVLKKAPGMGGPLLKGEGFDALKGGTSSEGIHSWSVQQLSLDGSRGQGATGPGLQFYGYGFTLLNVTIYDCADRGMWSEWGGALSPNDSMEAMLVNVKVHDCTAGGIYWQGPHDSQWLNIVAYSNGPAGAQAGSSTRGIDIRHQSPGLRVTNAHSWGVNQRYAWWLEALAVGLDNCTGEGAEGAQVVIASSDCQIFGGKYFGARADKRTVGIEIGAPGLSPAGTFVDTKVIDCNLGALKFTSDAGIGRYLLSVWQTSGSAVVGTPSASNRFDLQVSGGAAYGSLAGLKPVTFQEDVGALRDLQVGNASSRLGLFGAAPATRSTGWSASGTTPLRTLTGTSGTTEVRNVLATLIQELKRYGLLG